MCTSKRFSTCRYLYITPELSSRLPSNVQHVSLDFQQTLPTSTTNPLSVSCTGRQGLPYRFLRTPFQLVLSKPDGSYSLGFQHHRPSGLRIEMASPRPPFLLHDLAMPPETRRAPSFVAFDESYEASIHSDGSVSGPGSAKFDPLVLRGGACCDSGCHHDAGTAESLSSIKLDPLVWSRPTPPTAWDEAQEAEDARRAARVRLSSWLEELPSSQLAPGVFVPWESGARRKDRITNLIYRFDRLFIWRRHAPRVIIGIPSPATRDELPDTTVLSIQRTDSVCVAVSSQCESREPRTATITAVADSLGHLQPPNVLQRLPCDVQFELPGFGSQFGVSDSTSNNGVGQARTLKRVLSCMSVLTPVRRVQSTDSLPSISQEESPRKRTKLVHPFSGQSSDTDVRNTNNPASRKALADITIPTASAVLTFEGARHHDETCSSERHHSADPKRGNNDPSGPLSDQDFVAWMGHCWFYAHNRAAYSSQAWSSCQRHKNAISHITVHAEDVHGLSRGQGGKHPKQNYLVRCAQNDPSVEGNAPCDVCCSVDTWTTGQFEVPDHDGAAVCLRCYSILATKHDLFAHLNQEFPCASHWMKLSKQRKTRILYTAFCSATEPPSGKPSAASLPVTANENKENSQGGNVQNSAMRPALDSNKGKLTTPLATIDSVLAQVPELAPESFQIWHPQPQHAITAGSSLLRTQACLSSETSARPCPAGTGPPTAVATRFADLRPALDQHPPTFSMIHPPTFSMIQGPPNWSVDPFGLNPTGLDEGYGTLGLLGVSSSLFARGQETAPSAGVSYAPPLRFPSLSTFPLRDQQEFGHFPRFNYDFYGPEYSGLLGSGGLAGVDPSSRPLFWQFPDLHEGTPQTDAQQPAFSAYSAFGRPGNY